jgi:DNA-binding CsgD family transcriptional regulator
VLPSTKLGPLTPSGTKQVFVGRTREVDALCALASAAASGRPAAAVVVAEPGLGKTRLLAEVVPRLDLPCTRLHGYEPGREVPFSAAGGLLRALAGVPGAGVRLDRLLLGEAEPSSGLQDVRVFEAAFRCLLGFGPLAVVVDDLQWADAETLALLHYLLASAQPAGLPLFLLCASRPSAEAQAATAGLAAVVPAGQFLELTLAPLDRDEGIELVAGLAPQLGRVEAEALWKQAQGSPFWLEALAAELGAATAPTALMRSRFGSLDADAGRLFALLVVAARPLELVAAGELLEWQEARVRRAATVLANRALAVHEAGRVRITHDLIREAAARELPEPEQQRLHARLAAWLEAGAGDDLQLLSEALEHRRAARLPALELALRLARSPQRRLLGREGLSMLAAIPAESIDGDGLALQRELAALASELGEWSFALARWAALADELPARADRAQAALAAALAALRLGRAEEVYSLAGKARTLARADPLVAIEADVREGQALRWLENRVPEAVRLTDRAVGEARRLVDRRGDLDRLGDAERSVYLGALRAQLDAAIRAGDADTVARSAAEIGEAARNPVEAVMAASDAIFSLIMFDGLPRQAEPRARRALEESRRLVLPTLEVEASHWLGWTLHYLGRLEEAEEIATQTVVLAERVGAPDRFGLPNVRAVAHMVSASRGEWRPAVAALAAQIGESPEPHLRLNVRMMHLPTLVRFSGRPEGELADWLTAMREDAEAAACERCWWQSTLLGAEARARVGDVAAARAALAEWDAAHPEPRAGPAARRAYVEALLAAAEAQAASLPLFERAALLAEQAGHLLLRLWIELDAAVARGGGDRPAAVEALRSSARAAEGMGAVSEQRLAVQQLRRLGVRTWRRGRTGAAGTLSTRERQIADLVAAGASNPEVAAALFLSRKTVERHVTNILAKLGARNRVELAALLPPEDGGGAG